MFAQSPPIKNIDFPILKKQLFPSPLGLATSLPEEFSYIPKIEGMVPEKLRGVLYRNGPGLFDRGELRKRNILDGDGMLQAFNFTAEGAHYQNKFIRTKKYVQESVTGKFIYSTWTTQAPGGVLSNLLARKMASQAGVTVFLRNDRLYAFDDGLQAYEIHPTSLDTLSPTRLGLPEDCYTHFAAHSKIDSKTGEWILVGSNQDNLYITIINRKGQFKSQRIVQLPRLVFMHDFFVTAHYIIFNLHPAFYDKTAFLTGFKSFAESLQWRPEEGNLILVVDRRGKKEPFSMKTKASWMWHTLNAYDQDREIVADFIGYDYPDQMLGDKPSFYQIMKGQIQHSRNNGTVRRYMINPSKQTIREITLAEGNYEFPIVNPQHSCYEHRYGYFAKTRQSTDVFWSEICRLDTLTSTSEIYTFPEGRYCAEPIFAPMPNYKYSADNQEEPGWLLTQVYDSHLKHSYLAIFEADNLAVGPAAKIHLSHHVPLSFHGFWHGK